MFWFALENQVSSSKIFCLYHALYLLLIHLTYTTECTEIKSSMQLRLVAFIWYTYKYVFHKVTHSKIERQTTRLQICCSVKVKLSTAQVVPACVEQCFQLKPDYKQSCSILQYTSLTTQMSSFKLFDAVVRKQQEKRQTKLIRIQS